MDVSKEQITYIKYKNIREISNRNKQQILLHLSPKLTKYNYSNYIFIIEFSAVILS